MDNKAATKPEVDKNIQLANLLDGHHEFLCPKCGSTYFGSAEVGMIRYCHDQHDKGCKWKGSACFAPPEFDEDLNAMAEVEKFIAKKSNRHKYAEMVRNRTGAYYEEHLTGTRFTSAWGCLSAPARVRRDCALVILQKAAKLLKGEK